MIALFLSAFVTLFVVIDPPGCAPIYASITNGASAAQRRAMAVRAVGIAAAILLVFALWGKQLLGMLGIELDSFRIAGGIMLFIIAMDMVFEKRTQRREDRAQKIADTPEVEDVSVFPMAMPMIAGPGSIATVQNRSCTIAGPLMRWSLPSDSRLRIGSFIDSPVGSSNDSVAIGGGCVDAMTRAETTSTDLLSGQ